MALGPSLILALKAAVTAATLVWLLSLAALWSGKPRLHGRINLAFFVLALMLSWDWKWRPGSSTP